MLCGRLPFDDPRPPPDDGDAQPEPEPVRARRSARIERRVVRCDFKMDSGLSNEAQGLVRSMLQV